MTAPQTQPCLPLLLGFLVLTTPLAAAQASSQPRCYYPNGNVASNDTPCNLAVDGRKTHATCCGDGYACMSNRMCKATGDEAQKPGATIYVRGSCTDSRWASEDCPRFCHHAGDPFNDNVGGGNGIGMCRGDGTIFYCIDAAATDCDAGVNLLVFSQAPTAVTTIGVEPTTTSSSSTSSSTAPTASTASSLTPTTSPAPDRSSSNSSTVGIAVGASIGAVGIISAAILAFFLFRRRRTAPQSDGAASALSMGMAGSPGWNSFQGQGYHESVSAMGPHRKSMPSAPFYSPNPQDYHHMYSHQYQPLQQPRPADHVHEACSNERVEVPAVERPVEAFSNERVELPDSDSRKRDASQ